VIEVSEPVEQVAAGSPAFNVEWRGTKVFIEPLEPEATTNLFIWTKSGSRFSYELAPAGSVEEMHFAIDNQPTVVTVAKTQKPAVQAPVSGLRAHRAQGRGSRCCCAISIRRMERYTSVTRFAMTARLHTSRAYRWWSA
jgi:hypothetical protein